ncbi:carbohydrate-binding protein [Agaribacterium haliotis]|uniref:carbohydrate-binding protein n=1 Tax=Agaribacterium haliotis TaxID=2013869 RepID=UPI000BB53FA4|nr:carbohydrate-binding protein [Agaribacterium haliotis]
MKHNQPVRVRCRALALFLLTVLVSPVTWAANFYVATNGNDNNSGTLSQPWKTIQKAANTAKAGDHVFIKAGNYYGTVNVANSGHANAWISFDAMPGDEQKVILNNAAFRIIRKSYIRVSGIKINKSPTEGFYVEGPSSNITLSNNHTYDTKASGIGIWGVRWKQDPKNYENIRNVKILNNKVEKANNGGYNECITLANGIVGFEISGNEVFNGGDPTYGGEGIDIKLGIKNGVIKNNYVHDLTRRGIYLDAAGILPEFPKPYIDNVEVFNNYVWNNEGQGIALMTEGVGDIKNVKVYNNVLSGNSEDGIMFYKHPQGSGSIYNVEVSNNTIYNNPRYGILLHFPGSHSNIFRNNLMYKNGTDSYFKSGAYSASHNLSGRDPLFVNASSRNFQLRAGSPAINAGSAQNAPSVDVQGNVRVQHDIGAYEHVDTSTGSQSPYSNHIIPGLIQAEDFDLGGQGLAYSDSTPANSGGVYRSTEAVDIQDTSDNGGGFNVGWVTDGEWLEYSLADISSGSYDIHMRIAANGFTQGKSITLTLGNKKLGTLEFSGTGGWQNWKTVSLKNVSLVQAQNQVLKAQFNGGAFNLNWILFEYSDNSPGTPATVLFEAEDFINTGGSYGGFERYTTASGIAAINFNQRGDWAEYHVQVPESGVYRFEAKLATTQEKTAIEVFVDGSSRLKENVANNGNWDQFQSLNASTRLDLNAGQHLIRIQSSGASDSTWEWNADSFTLIKE